MSYSHDKAQVQKWCDTLTELDKETQNWDISHFQCSISTYLGACMIRSKTFPFGMLMKTEEEFQAILKWFPIDKKLKMIDDAFLEHWNKPYGLGEEYGAIETYRPREREIFEASRYAWQYAFKAGIKYVEATPERDDK